MSTSPIAPYGVTINQALLNSAVDMKAVDAFFTYSFPMFTMWNKIATVANAPKISRGRLEYQMNRTGNTYPAAQIAGTPTLTNGMLTINFDDTTYSGFRLNDIVESISGVWGRNTVDAAGMVVLEFFASPVDGQAAFDTNTDFLAGETVSSRGDAMNTENPDIRKRRIVEETDPFYNNVNLMTETAAITAIEGWEKSFLADVNGKTAQADLQLSAAMLRIAMNYAARLYTGLKSPSGSKFVTSDGLPQQIKKGGGYIGGHAGEVTESSLQAFIDGFAENGGVNGNKIKVVGGNRYIGAIQRNVIKNYVLYPGKENTFRTTDGIDGYHYAYNGYDVEFLLDPFLMNPNVFARGVGQSVSRYNNTGFWLSDAPVVTNSGTKPWIEENFYGPTDMIITEDNSILDANMNVRKGPTNGKLEHARHVIYNKNLQLVNPAAHAIDLPY